MIDNLIQGSTCRVTSGEAHGTGFILAPGVVLTARHCALPAIDQGHAIMLQFTLASGDVTLAAQVLDQSEELDACLLTFEQTFESTQIPLQGEVPREGSEWRSFGFPASKSDTGHRVTGKIDHVLPKPKARTDLDVTVDIAAGVANYRGYSGGAVVVDGVIVGMLRYKFSGSLGAISVRALADFLKAHRLGPADKAAAGQAKILADRDAFQQSFEGVIKKNPAGYVFLQGGHGLGKTTFCSTFRPADPALLNVGAYCIFLPGGALSTVHRAQPEVFFDWLLTTVTDLITGKGARKETRVYAQLATETEQVLKHVSEFGQKRGQQAVIFIDGLNEASDASAALLASLLGLLPLTLPPQLTIVLTAPNYELVASHLSGRVKTGNILSLPPLAYAASVNFCRKRLVRAQAEPTLVTRICDKAAGHPLYLHYIIEYANAQPAEHSFDDFPVLTGPIEVYYQTVWAKLSLDPQAVDFVALIARLRWGIDLALIVKVMSATEQPVFTTTLRRIRHLLANDTTTTIYHQSFAAFITRQSAHVEEISHDRLAALCRAEAKGRYGRLNLPYHLCRGSSEKRGEAIPACDQAWLDAAVSLSVEPDDVLADVDRALALAIERGPAVDFFRLLLLSQRAQFRYNVLFAQSAGLVAEALISLGRPDDALTYVQRWESLIVGAEETLVLAHRLITHGFGERALDLLSRFVRKLYEASDRSIQLGDYLRICSLHVQAVFLARLAGGPNGMKRYVKIAQSAREACEQAMKEKPKRIDEMMVSINCLSNSYFLTFRDCYPSLGEIKTKLKGRPVPSTFLAMLCHALFQFESWVDRYNLSKRRQVLAAKFRDLEELLNLGQPLETRLVPLTLDSLVRFGSPTALVQLLASRTKKATDRPLALVVENGVDVNFGRLAEDMNRLRTAAFLEDLAVPERGDFGATTWLTSLEQLAKALFWCDGRARRAKADSNGLALKSCFEDFRTNVADVVVPTLARRVSWENAYAIPEQLLPNLHRQVIELLVDCFPEHLDAHLETLVAAASDQWGMYTEGFRQASYDVLRELSREARGESTTALALQILAAWRVHVLRGVENRRELVPEILRLIPIHVTFGANEEAERLYSHMLAVSMGPSWYKEGQFSLMPDTLIRLPAGDDVRALLPQIAGYLERASGEMTFQRYVRAGKSTLIGDLVRRNYFGAAFAYFRRQTCGSLDELIAEARVGLIDKPTPDKGGRFPGGALEEQSAVLEIVRQARVVNWRFRWALLEIFLCGDDRHISDYAEEFAVLVNEAAAETAQTPALVRRLAIALKAETARELQGQFVRAFKKKLRPEYLAHFAELVSDAGPPAASDPDDLPSAPEADEEIEKRDREFFMPGIFGRHSAMKEAAKQAEAAKAAMKLGNRRAAKEQAVELLFSLQKAEWNIWSNSFSDDHRAAEALLRDGESDATALIRSYGPMVQTEKNTARWIVAEHLIGKITDLLSEAERRQLLNEVIEHTRLMVGSADAEIHDYAFLGTAAASDGNRELATLLFWLIDHPVELRRQRAAALVAWLAEEDTDLPAMMTPLAFSNQSGFGGDVLAMIIDRASAREPLPLWEKIFPSLDLESFLGAPGHVSRLEILCRVAKRAEIGGSSSATTVLAAIDKVLSERSTVPPLPAAIVELPAWARCIGAEWLGLAPLGLAGAEIFAAFHAELRKLCAPFTVHEIWMLEGSVSEGFREARDKLQNRWQGRAQAALNQALFPFVQSDQLAGVEAALRVCNPALPDTFLRPGENPGLRSLLDAIAKHDFTGAFSHDDGVLLHLRATFIAADEKVRSVEAVAVVMVSSARTRGFYPPKLTSFFRSSQEPELAPEGGPQETCSRLRAETVFFGPFTPSLPSAKFANQLGAKADDFVRQSWRFSRQHQLSRFGWPAQEGCALLIKRAALKLPPGKKLAWMIWVDNRMIGMFDEQNNQLL